MDPDETPQNCLMLTDYLWTRCNNLQETPLTKDFSWFANGSYLKDKNGNYHVGYAIVIPSEVIEEVPLSLATWVQ